MMIPKKSNKEKSKINNYFIFGWNKDNILLPRFFFLDTMHTFLYPYDYTVLVVVISPSIKQTKSVSINKKIISIIDTHKRYIHNIVTKLISNLLYFQRFVSHAINYG